MAEIDGQTIIARALKQQGVTSMFGVVGIPVSGIASAAQKEGLTYIGMRHEMPATYAAQAVSYLGGRISTALAVSGPGVLNAVGVHDRPMFVADIGGGSTEVVVGLDDEVLFARSFKLGAVRLTDRFFSGTTLHPSAVPSCRAFIRSSLSVVAPEVLELGFEVVAASSGTAETVARIIQSRRKSSEPKSMNRFEFSGDEVRATVAALVAAPTVEERAKRFALEPNRADIILAGALILEGLVDVFELKSLVFSDYALREGLLLDTLRREVRYRGTVIALTYMEFGILHLLAKRPGWVFQRYQIVDALRGEDYAVTERTVDVQISNLRRKLGAASVLIETIRGVGYRVRG